MIIYSLGSNQGGMLRVVESLSQVFDHLPDDFPLRIFVFAKEMPPGLNDKRFVWMPLDFNSQMKWEVVLAELKQRIKEYLGDTQVSWVMGDFMTLSFFEDIETKIAYDVHFLGRPFYKALAESKNAISLDQFHRNNFVLGLHLNHFPFLRKEFELMKKASCFIANSKSSENHLRANYRDVTAGKEINYIPVSSQLDNEITEIEKNKKATRVLYFHGRFHPQKGIHFLFSQDWNDLPLTIRGFEDALLTPDRVLWLKEKGISAVPWTSQSSVIRDELMDHQAVLFPSIYEPWGLSLQEALALGRICIAHPCQGGHEEQIVDGENGFLVDFSSPDLKKRIKEIINLPQAELSRISNNAQSSSYLGHEERIKKLKDYFLWLRINA
ncbi:MAG: glycosyltransferase family 4 protein [Bacteriovoracaceae bacterium]